MFENPRTRTPVSNKRESGAGAGSGGRLNLDMYLDDESESGITCLIHAKVVSFSQPLLSRCGLRTNRHASPFFLIVFRCGHYFRLNAIREVFEKSDLDACWNWPHAPSYDILPGVRAEMSLHRLAAGKQKEKVCQFHQISFSVVCLGKTPVNMFGHSSREVLSFRDSWRIYPSNGDVTKDVSYT
jgi:hypothetical protein